MARQTRRKRRGFGTGPEYKERDGRIYAYYSYVTPRFAFSQWPELGLGERQWHCVTPGNEWDGEAWLADAQRRIKAGIWEPEKLTADRERREGVTFRDWATQWVETRKKADGTDLKETAKQKYRESLDLYLVPFFGDMPMTAITPADVQRWYDAFQPVRLNADRDARRARVYRHLKTMMKDAATVPLDNTGATLIAVSPCRLKVGKPKPKREHVRPTPQQLAALLDALPPWCRLVADICANTGLRESEALGLTRGQIDMKALTIDVRQQVQRVQVKPRAGHYRTVTQSPKTESSRDTVRMPAALAGRISAWMDAHGIEDAAAPLFVQPATGRRMYGQNYRNAFARARAKVPGLENMVPHDLRADMLSSMVDNGATPAEVMRQGRHTTMAVASRYQATGEHMAGVMDRMNARASAMTGTPAANPPAPAASASTRSQDAAPAVPAAPDAMPSLSPDRADVDAPAAPAPDRGTDGADARPPRAAVVDAADVAALLRGLTAEGRARALRDLPDAVKNELLNALLMM